MPRLLKMAAGGAAAALLGVGLLTAAPAGASTGWTVQHVPKLASATKRTALASVSCVSGGTCTAVGYATAVPARGTALQMLYAVREVGGGAWAVQAVPEPADYSTGQLTGVSCTSASSCVAVGYYQNTANVVEALTETFDGTSWTIQAIPDPAGSIITNLTAVSCSAATACMAVGIWTTGGDNGYTLAELWNGTNWSIVPTADDAPVATLSGVSCPSASFCAAVGYDATSPLAETWDGSAWTSTPARAPSGVRSSSLQGVSCSSATACTAVGFTIASTTAAESGLAERWSGTGWRIQTVPSGSPLMGVSCPTTGSCTAVGETYRLGPAPAADGWSPAGGWTAGTPATPANATVSVLSGVSCQSATTCTAVGYYDVVGNGQGGKPLAEHE